MRAELVLAGHRRELVLDGFRVEDAALDEAGFDLELLVRSLRNALTTLAAALGILVAPGDAGHADERVVELVAARRVLERLLDERVLDDPVLDAALAELVAELGHLLDGHPLEVEEDRRGHLVEARLDRRRSAAALLCAFHQLMPPRSCADEVRRVDLARRGPSSSESVMLRR